MNHGEDASADSAFLPRWAVVRPPLAVGVATVGLGWIVYGFVPAARPGILEEDHVVEWLSALAFLAAGVLGLGLWLRGRTPTERLAVAVAAFLGLLGFGDELSFGERLLSLDMPRIRGLKIDGAHDFAEVVARGGRDAFRAAPAVVAVCGIATVAAGAALAWRFRDALAAFARACLATSPRVALIAAVAAVALATLIDLPLAVFDHDAIKATEELLELAAAVLLLAVPILAVRGEPEPGR